MKKILISILIILLLILGYFIIAKGLNVGFIQIAGIDGIKEQSSKLNADFEETLDMVNNSDNDVSYLKDLMSEDKLLLLDTEKLKRGGTDK